MGDTIGEIIRTLRKEQDITQDQLAAALNLSSQSVSKWETGQANPDVTLIPAIACYFKVSVDTLFAFDRKAPYAEVKRRAELEKQDNMDARAVIALWEDLLKEYPNDYRIRKELVRALCAGDGQRSFDRIFEHSIAILRTNRNPIVEEDLLLTLKTYLGGGYKSKPDKPLENPKNGLTHRELALEQSLGPLLSQTEVRALTASKGAGQANPPKGKRVLIVDDAAFMRDAIKEILTRGGYTVIGEAANGYEAVEAAHALLPDLITMDITMPDMDGLVAAEKILGERPEICVIMVTAMAYEPLVLDSLGRGARGFVSKPFQGRDLLAALDGLLLE